VSRADLNKEPEDVSRMFDEVAPRYDFLNDLLSLWRTKSWRKSVTSIISPKSGMKILDIAAGTGSSSVPFAKAGAEVIALDFSQGMIEAGKRRNPEITFVQGDALNLPFDKDQFDVTTISFGLRNTVDTSKALKEALRVTKPGGRIAICEFSEPTNRFFRKLYFNYLLRALPAIARRTASNPQAYIYLAESILAWPNQQRLADLMEKAGWSSVSWKNLTFGIVAVHTGSKS
jgi:demethylmenaquinone methyltransferase / 2-methoxy-6-polyprenyl-1,4-benzoquinol methylase